MKVKVYAPAFCSFEDIDEKGCMTLPEVASLNDVYKKLRVPFLWRKLLFASVNYNRVELRTELKGREIKTEVISVTPKNVLFKYTLSNFKIPKITRIFLKCTLRKN